MKTSLVVGGILFCSTVQADVVNVVLLAGQSNASGRASIDELPASPFDSEIEFYYDTDITGASTRVDSGGEFVPFEPPGSTFGPEKALGRTLTHQGVENLAIVKVTRGGTNLRTDWEKGNTSGDQLYDLLIDTAGEAFAAIEERGDTVNIIGFVWQQGESDAGNERNNPGNYQSNLTQFISDVRTDLNQPELPFLIGGVIEAGREELYAAQQATAAAVDNAEFITSTQTVAFDVTTHFDGRSQRWLGTRFARTLTASDQFIEFEQPQFDVGGIDGQNGWRSGDPAENLVVSTYSSGRYVAGQAAGHVDSGGTERFGTLSVVPTFGNSISASFFAGDAEDHDLDGVSDYDDEGDADSTVRLFGWADDSNGDGIFGNTDARSVGIGLDNDGTIGLRTADGPEISTGIAYELDNWYQLTLTWSDADDEGDRLVALYAEDLTGEALLNNGEPIYTAELTSEQFGDDPSTWVGTAVRATRGLIDNIQFSTSDSILDGDYNGDGVVDNADFTVWRDTLGSGGELQNDFTTGVNLDDYSRWRRNFGASLPAAAVSTAVPAPSSTVLLAISFVGALVRRQDKPT